MNKVLIVFVLAFCSAVVPAAAEDYYVDAMDGSDFNRGTSPGDAWKSIQRLNAHVFEPGDRILFKSGTEYAGQLAPAGSGVEGRPIVIDSYGQGPKPLIEAKGLYHEALLLYNVEYWEVNNLELTNSGVRPEPFRAGVRVLLENFGTAHHIYLRNLTVRDVNGTNYKSVQDKVTDESVDHWTCGTGITCDVRGAERSRYVDLRIEDCYLLRTDRDGIATRTHFRNKTDPPSPNYWYPSRKVVIRNNRIEDFGGDGIVVRGCHGALIEHNVLKYGRMRCKDYAAGIWPHTCDSTVIQYNEVSYMRGTMDGMGYDSDGSCENTVIQYNYSHDNDGGFVLICGGETNINTVVRYNISQNDSHRILYFTGPLREVSFYNNIIYYDKPDSVYILWPGGGGQGYGDIKTFSSNVFYFQGPGTFAMGGIEPHNFENNWYYGRIIHAPNPDGNHFGDPGFVDPGSGGAGFGSLGGYKMQDGSPLKESKAGWKQWFLSVDGME
jgi:hypothetical protein